MRPQTPDSLSREEPQRQVKKRKVRFADNGQSSQDDTPTYDSVSTPPASQSGLLQLSDSFRLVPSGSPESQDICAHLLRSGISTRVISDSSVLRLDSDDFSHQFFPGHISSRLENAIVGRPVELSRIFQLPLDEALSDVQRLRLAATLVKSALQLYSTLWWPEDWTPYDVSYFERGKEDLNNSLQTLHLTSTLCPNASCPRSTRRELEEEMADHGIHNITLWGLGIVLLQIGLWEPIDIGSHKDVRNRVRDLRFLGREYRTITTQLINCDFGLGKYSLKDQMVRNEVYKVVLGQLEEAIGTLRLEGL